MEERVRKLFSDENVPARQRALMAASFAAVFVTPFWPGACSPSRTWTTWAARCVTWSTPS